MPGSAHERQVPAHAVAQQTPCSHRFELQSAAAAHAVPIGLRPQLPVTQLFGLVQSPDDVHDERQAAPAPHTYGSHDDADVVWQVPVPLQVRAGVNVDPVQVAAAQVVPAAYSRQPPVPSQNPSVPQLGMPLSAH